MQLPDGVVVPPLQAAGGPYDPYDRYIYGPDAEPYGASSNYMLPNTSKPYEKTSHEDVNYGYSTYTPPQFSANTSEQQIYTNPYYSNSYGSQNNATVVTDSQSFSTNVNPNQPYEAYINPMGPIPEASLSSSSAYSSANQTDMIANFAQMQVSQKKEPEYSADYSRTFYSVQYPNVSTPGSAAYTSAPQISNTSLAPSQAHSDYASLNYPYSSDSTQYNQKQPTATSVDPAYSYSAAYASTSQGYTYTNAVTSTTTIDNSNNLPYQYLSEVDSNYNPALAQFDEFDKPIKSHTTGEAISFQPSYQSYNAPPPRYSSQPEMYNPTNAYGYTDQTNTSFAQSYQNHPGYNFNSSTGAYEYNFGSQNSYTGYDGTGQENVNYQPTDNKDPNWPQQAIYTSAGKIGTCETVQSPTDNTQIVPQMPAEQPINTQIYYNNSYGYQNVTSPTNEVPVAPQPTNTYQPVADTNQAGYMQNVPTHHEQVSFNHSPGKPASLL